MVTPSNELQEVIAQQRTRALAPDEALAQCAFLDVPSRDTGTLDLRALFAAVHQHGEWAGYNNALASLESRLQKHISNEGLK